MEKGFDNNDADNDDDNDDGGDAVEQYYQSSNLSMRIIMATY